MKKIFYLLFITTYFLSYSQENKRGEVTIMPLPTTNQDYAVYMPSSLKEATSLPVVYIFSPADYKLDEAINSFKEAANMYGYLLVATHIMPFESYDGNILLARKLFTAVEQQYPIDSNAIITAGLADGARLATAIAVIAKSVRGVIACSASLPSESKYLPTKNTFSFVGIVGDEDYGMAEIINAENYYKLKKITTNVIFFDGGREWPPKNSIIDAFRGMSVLFVKKGLLNKGDSFVTQAMVQDEESINNLVTKGKFIYAKTALESYKKNYKDELNKEVVKTFQKTLNRSKQYRSQLAQTNAALEEESYYYLDYAEFLPKDVEAANLQQLAYWEEEIAALDTLALSKKVADKKMVKRIKSYIFDTAKSLERNYSKPDQATNRLFTNILMTLAKPTYYQAYIDIIQYAFKKLDYGMALFYAEELFANGYTNVDELANTEGLALFVVLPDYKELLEHYFSKKEN